MREIRKVLKVLMVSLIGVWLSACATGVETIKGTGLKAEPDKVKPGSVAFVLGKGIGIEADVYIFKGRPRGRPLILIVNRKGELQLYKEPIAHFKTHGTHADYWDKIVFVQLPPYEGIYTYYVIWRGLLGDPIARPRVGTIHINGDPFDHQYRDQGRGTVIFADYIVRLHVPKPPQIRIHKLLLYQTWTPTDILVGAKDLVVGVVNLFH